MSIKGVKHAIKAYAETLQGEVTRVFSSTRIVEAACKDHFVGGCFFKEITEL